MGAYLSKPEKEKSHEIGENELIKFSSCSMQGWRINQEDAHNCIVDFAPGISFFAVYDGHGGREVSKYLAETFPNYLKEKDLLANNENVQKKLEQLFVDFDANLCNEETIKIMSKMKEEEKKTDEIVDTEEAEQKEREALYEEAIALSQEANVSLETIIKQYAKCRTFLMEKSTEAEGSRGSKRGVSAPSPQILKRRKVKDGEVMDTKEGVDENGGDQQENGKNDEKMEVQKENEEDGKGAKNLKENRTEKNIEKEVNGEFDSKAREMSDEETVGNKEDKNGDHEQPSANSNSTNDSSEKEQKLESSTSSSAAAAAEQVQPSSSTGSAGILVRKYKERFGGGEDGAIQLAKVFFPAEDPSYNEDEDPDFVEEEEEGDDEEEEEETEVDGEGDEEVGDEEGAEGGDEEEEEDEEEEFDEADLGTLLGSTEGTKAGFDSGSTACVALVYKNRIIVANIGDSRAVLCRGGKAMDLSEDHKPEDAKEKKRIMAAGGKVGEDGRVNGGLNLSRAFGDHYYKQKSELPLEEQMITSLPDVTSTETTAEDEFLVIACDGIWNSMSSQQCCDFIMERIGKMELKEITAEICEHCCAKDTAGDGSGCDNETVILIDLKKNQRPKISPKECTSPELAVGTNSEVEEAKEAGGTSNGGKKEEGENAK